MPPAQRSRALPALGRALPVPPARDRSRARGISRHQDRKQRHRRRRQHAPRRRRTAGRSTGRCRCDVPRMPVAREPALDRPASSGWLARFARRAASATSARSTTASRLVVGQTSQPHADLCVHADADVVGRHDGLRRALLAGVIRSSCSTACSTGTGCFPATFTEGRRNRDVLSPCACATAQATRCSILRHPAHSSSELDAHVELPARAGALQVDAIIRPELAGTLLIGGLPRSRLPFLLGLLGLAAALSIVAVTQLRREGELAQLRAGFRVERVARAAHAARADPPLPRDAAARPRIDRGAARWSLGHIDRETTRLAHLVENVLRFSTLGGNDPTQREPVDVGTRGRAHRRRVRAARRVAAGARRRRRGADGARRACVPTRCGTSCSICSTTR